MALVEHTRGALRAPAVPRILAIAATLINGLTCIINQVRPRIRCRQAEALRESVLVPGLQGMVDGVGIGRDHADPGVALVRAPRLNVTGPGLGLVEILQARIDVHTLATYPAQFQ